MSFRIDSVTQTNVQGVPCWEIDFKGVAGASEYGTFYIGTDGIGLFTLETWTDGCVFMPVPNSERVFAPLEMSKDDVTTLIATWMKLQGWGTELNQLRQPIHRGLVRIVDPGDSSGDQVLVFSPQLLQLLGWRENMKLNVEAVDGALLLKPVKSERGESCSAGKLSMRRPGK